MVALSVWVFLPFIILAGLLLLLGLLALLGRIAGGKYLRAILVPLAKIPFMARLFRRMSAAALERQNPELASAVRKMERFGTPTNPQQAQRALNMLTPGERRAYIEAAGDQGQMPEPTNRSERRRMEKVVPPQGRPGSAGRRSSKRKR
jgi:hypothetical protein